MRQTAQLTLLEQSQQRSSRLVSRRRWLANSGAGVMALFGITSGCSMVESSDSKRQRMLTERMNLALEPFNSRVGDPVFIRVFKVESLLELWIQPGGQGPFVKFRDFPICSFSGLLGPKQREGDKQSPEGFYTVTANQLNPNSEYHRSFNLGFPNALDQMHGRTGSHLMIHGGCVSIGCYAMTNQGIDQIYTLVSGYLERDPRPGERMPLYMYVHAFPFVPSVEQMTRMQQAGSPWIEFWQDLWAGYDAFNLTRMPPRIGIKNRRYSVAPIRAVD